MRRMNAPSFFFSLSPEGEAYYIGMLPCFLAGNLSRLV